MPFSTDLPNWKSYSEEDYYMKSVPDDFWEEFSGIAFRAASTDRQIVSIINHISEIIPCSPTNNWGGSFIREDLNDRVRRIQKKVEDGKLPILMDCLAVLSDEGNLTCDEINELLSDHKIGYECERDLWANSIIWHTCAEGVGRVVDEISETQSMIKPVSEQAYEEFERAKKSLEESKDERARKDAVRSCLSALEAVVKEYGKDNEIKNATRKLRDSKDWGRGDIVKDGESLFNTMHRIYPDLRHGSTEHSNMSIEEAEYWIGRFNVFLKYMKQMADRNGVK